MVTTAEKRLKDNVQHIADVLNDQGKWFAEQKERYGDMFDEDEHASAMAWLDDALDITYMVSSDGEYRGAEVLVTFGGPNIYVNTLDYKVRGYWGGDYAEANFRDDLDLDATLEELWACR